MATKSEPEHRGGNGDKSHSGYDPPYRVESNLHAPILSDRRLSVAARFPAADGQQHAERGGRVPAAGRLIAADSPRRKVQFTVAASCWATEVLFCRPAAQCGGEISGGESARRRVIPLHTIQFEIQSLLQFRDSRRDSHCRQGRWLQCHSFAAISCQVWSLGWRSSAASYC